MRKHLITAVLAAACACIMAVPAFAGVWTQDDAGIWHYDYLGRGVKEGYLSNQWAWIDSDHDGVSQCFYFDENSNMAASTVVQGYTVAEFGHWTVDGVIQNRREGVSEQQVSAEVSRDITAQAPKESNYYSAYETAETDSGLTWANGFALSGGIDHAAYAIYDLGENYSYMTITYAPKAGQDVTNLGRVSVTGVTTGKKLYHSPEIGVHSAPVSVTFGCARENAVRINVVRGFDVLFTKVGLIK